MNRTIYYSGEQLRSFDLLWSERDSLAALSSLEIMLAGQTTTVVNGLTAAQTSPTSLSVTLTQGIIAQQGVMDSTSFGSLSADADVVQQIGFAAAQSVLFTTAGLSAGQSRWALIEAQFAQVDVIRPGDPTGGLLNYYNSANPTQPLQGPGGNGQTQSTERQATISVRVVYGSPATTGSEVPPNVDSGWVGLYLVDLTFGQSTITTGQILVAGPSVGANVPSNYPVAPFMAGLLNAHHNGAAGQAPQIDLTAEVKNTLPLTRLPASNTIGGGLAVFKLHAGNPNGSVAGNAAVNGSSDMCWDTTNLLLYICSTTGSTSTAVWTTVAGQSTSIFAGGTSTGSANAQVVASTTPAGFARTPGQVVTFTAGFTNTGSTTMNVDATGVATIQKNTGSGNVNLSGGEITTGSFITVIWTGTVYLLQIQVLGNLATLNIGAWLKNDGSGNLTIKNGALLGDDGSGNFNILNTAVTPGAYTRTKLTVSASGQITAAASGAFPTRTELTVGSGTYTTPAGVKRLFIRMMGAGGGGGGKTGNGQNGTQSSFNSIVAAPGQGGAIFTSGNPGLGGIGGGPGSGTAYLRRSGGNGMPGGSSQANNSAIQAGGMGAVSPFGGAGAALTASTNADSNGGNAQPNTGSGGGGASLATNTGAPGGGGAGEYVEIQITNPAGSYSYTVGAKGLGGTGSVTGGNGSDGTIIIDEFYD